MAFPTLLERLFSCRYRPPTEPRPHSRRRSAVASGGERFHVRARHPRFAPFSRLFKQALDKFGRPPLPVGVHSPGHVAETDEKAREDFWPRYLQVITHVAETRGFAIPTKEPFLYEVGPRGALFVGSPETVAQKIAANLPALGANRFDLKYGMGGLSHEAVMTNIELYGTQVIPRVRELLN
jgi:alkanesulfonate monooxygenase SsuD/methylene tetrahydromethanopterin reductase-like flavin-dependent oxidoreductase (luciferase family)